MIETPTVFILGAGASKPYGFPAGNELTGNIIRGLNSEQALHQRLTEAGFQASQLEGFRSAFERSGRYSIDAFLQHRPDHSDVGRAAIAVEIMRAELPGRLYQAPENQDWYRHLVHKMNAPKTNFERNQVAFVTFNYDRSLEYYLFQTLVHSYGLEDGEAAEIVKRFPFVHLHGDVGELSWLAAAGRPYTGNILPEEIRRSASRIHIVHDDVSDRENRFSTARGMINAAERVVMLGFGFDQINMKRLNLDVSGKPIIATCLGLTSLEQQSVLKFTQSRLKLHEMDALALLRQVVDLTS